MDDDRYQYSGGERDYRKAASEEKRLRLVEPEAEEEESA
jgi:hypothetical protein